MENQEFAKIFSEMAELLELGEENPFRIRAYRNAARMLDALERDLDTLADKPAELDALPGIGPDLAGKIVEVVTTGSCTLLQRLRKELPAGIVELQKVSGLGPKRVRTLHQELGIVTLEQLRQAADQQRIQSLHGFGPLSEQRILAALAVGETVTVRFGLEGTEAVIRTATHPVAGQTCLLSCLGHTDALRGYNPDAVLHRAEKSACAVAATSLQMHEHSEARRPL